MVKSFKITINYEHCFTSKSCNFPGLLQRHVIIFFTSYPNFTAKQIYKELTRIWLTHYHTPNMASFI